jgi:hypothetical protein
MNSSGHYICCDEARVYRVLQKHCEFLIVQKLVTPVIQYFHF